MSDPNQLFFFELIWVVLLAGLIFAELFSARASSRSIDVFKPTVVLAVILAYYCLIGPLIAISSGEWFERGIDRRPDMVFGWAGATVFYFSTLVGFYGLSAPRFGRRFLISLDPQKIYGFGTRLCQLGLLFFTLVTGFSVVYFLNPFAARSTLLDSGVNVFQSGGLAVYLMLSLNFMIPGLCLLFTSWLQARRHLVPLIVWSTAATGIFVTLGFRFRLVLVAVPFLIIWYMARRRRPRTLVVTLMAAALIFTAGYIGLTRNYGTGLDLAAVQALSGEEIFATGFDEAHVFMTTSAMIAATPEKNPYVGLQPVLSVLQFPIPRSLFPAKDTFGYLEQSMSNLFGSSIAGVGAALLCFGEWFLMAGWLSLVAVSLAFGWGLRCLWNWLLARQHEPLAVTCYALAASYIYMIVSRGYMAQVVAGAVFTVLPLFWIYYRWAKPVTPVATPSAPSLPRR